MAKNSDSMNGSSSGMAKIYAWLSYAFYFVCFAALAYHGPVIRNDSKTYIAMEAYRDPIYPLFLKFCMLFGNHFGLRIAVVLQLLFGAFAIYLLIKYLKGKFSLNVFVVFLLSVIMIYPYLNIPMFNSGSSSVGNYLMTESLAYPLFLIAMRFLIEAVVDKNWRKGTITVIVLSILILVRGQFKYMYVVELAMIGYLLYVSGNKKNALMLCGVIIGCFVISNLVDRTYHYVVHRKFSTTPFAGNQFFAPTLFLAKPGDENIFKDSSDKALAGEMINRVHAYRLKNDALEHSNDLYHFKRDYNNIIWQSSFYIITDKYKDKSDFEKWEIVDKIATRISAKLASRERNSLIAMYIENVKEQIGQISNWVFVLMFSFVSLFYFLKRPRNGMATMVIFTFLIIWGNVLLVSLLESSEFRYNLYCLVLFCTVMIIFASTMYENMLGNKTMVEGVEN